MNMSFEKKIPALGRPFLLGQLYDCRSDTVLSGKCLWDSYTMANAMKSSIINDSNHLVFEDTTIGDKLLHLGIDKCLMLSIQSGLVPLVGSSTYLNDRCSSPSLPKITLKYECSTKYDTLNVQLLRKEKFERPDVFVKGTATHVVCGIRYGGQTLFVFEKFRSTESQKSEHNLLDAVKKLPNLCGGCERLPEHLEKESSEFRCNVFSDFDISDKLTYKEVALLFGTFSHSIVGRGNSALPIEVTLHPLDKLDPLSARVMQIVDHNIGDQLGSSLNHLNKVIANCQDMLKLQVAQKFPTSEDDVHEFLGTLTAYKQLIQKQIKSTLIRIRSGSIGENVLNTILDEKENSPFAQTQLEMWMKLKEVKNAILRREDSMKDTETVQATCPPPKRLIICLNINMPDDQSLATQAKSYLRKLQRGYLMKFSSNNKECQVRHEYDLPMIRLFRDFVDANFLDDKLSFSFAEEAIDENKPVMYVSINEGDVIRHENFQLPMAPTRLVLKRALHDRLQIEWSGDNHGRYEVQYEEISVDRNEELPETIPVDDPTGNNIFEITGLKLGSTFGLQIRSICEIGHSAWSPKFFFKTLPATAPGKPTATYDDNSCKVILQWQKPSHTAPGTLSKGYIITVNDVTYDKKFEIKVDSKRGEHFDFTNLEPTSKYTFSVRAVFSDSQTEDSEMSVTLEPTPTTLMKAQLLHRCKKTDSSDPSIYQLDCQQTHENEKQKIAKCELGEKVLGQTEKVIMVVGATGAGKSTLINGLVNYVFGVNWKDNFRFQLIPDSEGSAEISQAESQTKWITSYTLHHQKGFAVPFTLTVVDTPGFGDTGGIERDKEITTQIRNFFTTRGDNGIDHIDAIGFVTQASLARLTPTQKFIFDHVLSLFGKDISDNIFLLVTFADGQLPPVLAAVKEAEIPYKMHFKFNNSALYGEKMDVDGNQQYYYALEDDAGPRGFDQMFWEMGEYSFKYFFRKLGSTEPKSLLLTKDVLNERLRLETHVAGIQLSIRTGLNKLQQLRVEVEVLEKHQTDIDLNKNFTYTVREEQVKTENIPKGKYITNCLQCNFTCHYPCYIPNDEDKRQCAAMNTQMGFCEVCPSKCVWSVHKNMTYRFLIQSVETTKTAEDLKSRYVDATGKKLSAEQLIKKVLEDFYEVQMDVLTKTEEVRKSLNRLKDIALKPNPLSTVEYIDILIISEQTQKSPGWKNRIQQLQKVKEEAKVLQQLAKPGYDPFKQYKEQHFNLKKKEMNEQPLLDFVRKLFKSFEKK